MSKKFFFIFLTVSFLFVSKANAQVFENPLQFDTVEGLLNNIMGNLQSIIAVLAIIFIVIGGIMYITSAGNDKQITRAKDTIFSAMIGLAIAIAAPSFLKEIALVLGWTEGASGEGLTLSEIAFNVLNFLMAMIGAVSLIMLVVGGIYYVTAAGDEDRIETGKSIVTYSIVGLAVALSSMAIVKQIAVLING